MTKTYLPSAKATFIKAWGAGRKIFFFHLNCDGRWRSSLVNVSCRRRRTHWERRYGKLWFLKSSLFTCTSCKANEKFNLHSCFLSVQNESQRYPHHFYLPLKSESLVAKPKRLVGVRCKVQPCCCCRVIFVSFAGHLKGTFKTCRSVLSARVARSCALCTRVYIWNISFNVSCTRKN